MTLDKEAYRQFLLSPFWIELRSRKLYYSPRCERCGSRQRLQCHHRFYRALWEQTKVEDLETLCDGCHNKEHNVPKKFYSGPMKPKKRKPRVKAWKREQRRIMRKRNQWSF